MGSRFKCADICGRTFTEPRSLSRHQDVCATWRRHLSSRVEQRREALIYSKGAERDPKRQKLNSGQPIRVAAQECSTNAGDSTSDGNLLLPSCESTASTRAHAESQAPDSGPLPSSTAPAVGEPQDSHTPLHTVLPPRTRRLPARFREQLPEPPPPIPPAEPCFKSRIHRVLLFVSDSFRTTFNQFGIARYYRHRPSYDPDSFLTADQLSNIVNRRAPGSSESGIQDDQLSEPELCSDLKPPPWPWRNMSIWHMMTWKLSGSSQKSDAELTRLASGVFMADDFNIQDLAGFNAAKEARILDEALLERSHSIFQKDGWKE
ncbi:hypothetical protein PAXRUDRAFT_18036, partial [Paxillus rubicundulus Ve08.2h10]